MAKHCVIPLYKEALLEMYVLQFEQATGLTAIVVGTYQPTTEQTNENRRMLGRVKETFAFGEQNFTLHSFCLCADEDQLTPEILALMNANSVQIMTEAEYLAFKDALL